VRIGCARTHFGCNPDRFHDLLGARSVAQRRLGMAPDAVGALRDMRRGNCNELFGLGGQRSFCEHALTEAREGFVNIGRELFAETS